MAGPREGDEGGHDEWALDQNQVGHVHQEEVDLLQEVPCRHQLQLTAPSAEEYLDQHAEEVGSTNSPQARMAPNHLHPCHP